MACGGGEGDDGEEESSEEEDEGVPDTGDGLGMGDCADSCGTPGCGECPEGPTMIAVDVEGGGVQIDATEVSNAAYAPMLEVVFDASVLPAGCDWKSAFEPEGWADELVGELPVVGVDWCDAAVYCAWVGKSLCGDVAGGPASYETAEDPVTDLWYRACSNDGARDYPYASSYEPEACNGGDAGLDDLQAVGSMASCEGGLSGLFDMSGNVWEWTDACEVSGGDFDTPCRRRGGSRHSDEDNLRCAVNSTRPRSDRDNAVGFRCCVSP
ncbi:SUMF1/EgtB/PvdO family nonheme iron enzyme [Pseudenhygromyxa sp. WMMC2535]|uniref:formylglycine-generating enzyme family protein n=1 Tax=Pseudenhygromyxa sp. WMMC2535 TaxID=2712867 RepID=UPI00155628A6|nr:SUMF1/EgtB/PvdO family nonheme iron enzyme [Pseudenhygromyxa sp. WMMC2535]NVB42898.1 SUMF1/EgtB/PvdO family nonheme iron enzyme [Pseudenhygromyxa sp. WMMC2535]